MRSKNQLEKIEKTFGKYTEDEDGRIAKVDSEMLEAQKVHDHSMETLRAAVPSGVAQQTGQLAEEGMVLVPVQKGTAIISPVQLNKEKINNRLAQVASQGGMLRGIDPNLMKYLAEFMFAMVTEAAVLPDQNPTATAQATPQARTTGTTQTGSSASGESASPADQDMKDSQDDKGSGEADPKQRRRELTDEQAKKEEEEFARLENNQL